MSHWSGLDQEGDKPWSRGKWTERKEQSLEMKEQVLEETSEKPGLRGRWSSGQGLGVGVYDSTGQVWVMVLKWLCKQKLLELRKSKN